MVTHPNTKRCQVCHLWRLDVSPDDTYSPTAGFCEDCARLFNEERATRSFNLDKILREAQCGAAISVSEARSVALALGRTARDLKTPINCCVRIKTDGGGHGGGRRKCQRHVMWWTQGRFYCAEHAPELAKAKP
jgi:hypothetical protein